MNLKHLTPSAIGEMACILYELDKSYLYDSPIPRDEMDDDLKKEEYNKCSKMPFWYQVDKFTRQKYKLKAAAFLNRYSITEKSADDKTINHLCMMVDFFGKKIKELSEK